MSKFNFESQIATSRSQSERLLALGLKPETADMSSDGWNDPVVSWGMEWSKEVIESGRLPAWSLHRLIDLLPKGDIAVYHEYYREGKFPMWWHIEFDNWQVWLHDAYERTKVFRESPYLFGNIIECIEWLIKEGHFNKEYLV